jgi:hypothetical protein
MNVEPEVQPKAAPHCFWGGALRGGNGPVWMGSEERQCSIGGRSGGRGRAAFPPEKQAFYSEDKRGFLFLKEVHQNR